MVKKFIKNILAITVPTLIFCLLIAELVVFRFFIPASNPPLYAFDPNFKLLHFQPQTSGVYTDGRFGELRGHWSANNFGWNSEIDYVPGIGAKKPLVAVIGDSYVEALQVDVGERFPAVLQRLMGDNFLVYSFGISGAPLSQYLHMVRYVNQVFQPQVLVILVVHNDFDESLANLRPKPRFMQIVPRNGSFAEIPPTPVQAGAFLRIFRWSAVFRYLELNCDLSGLVRKISWPVKQPQSPPTYNANIDVDAVARERDLIRRSTRFLVAQIRAENPDKQIIIMMDGPRYDIYSNKLAKSSVWWLHELLRDACRDHRVEFLDLSEPFGHHFEKFRQTLESPMNAHWNRLGHELAAKALWGRLNETGALTRRTE